MNKLLAKLIASVLALTVAATLVAMSSYAWFTLSNTPDINGIQINIGGGETLKIAADQVVHNADGSVTHYPGAFGQDLSFASHESYAYINDLAGLLPASTADGVNWVVPDFYDENDPEVQNGLAQAGQLKGPEAYVVDNTLTFANQTTQQQSSGITGNYIYLDFWVVAPAEGFSLRVSTGSAMEDNGSYVITQMDPVADGTGGYKLLQPDESAAASVRIGFLINQTWAPEEDLRHYVGSREYDKRFNRLMGQYQEPGETAMDGAFTIYEPNGNLHPQNPEDHSYVITQPFGVVDGKVQPVDIQDRLSVQLATRWTLAPNGVSTLLEQEFTTAFIGRDLSMVSAEQITTQFYKNRLQGVYSPYLERGSFVKNTGYLYGAAENGVVPGDAPAMHILAGATDDAVIAVLSKNIPQRVRMFIWLEGQDSDCIGQKTASNLIINLELAGSNHKS